MRGLCSCFFIAGGFFSASFAAAFAFACASLVLLFQSILFKPNNLSAIVFLTIPGTAEPF